MDWQFSNTYCSGKWQLIKRAFSWSRQETHARSCPLQISCEFCSLVPRVLPETVVPEDQLLGVYGDLLASSERAQLRAVITDVVNQRRPLTQQFCHCLSTETRRSFRRQNARLTPLLLWKRSQINACKWRSHSKDPWKSAVKRQKNFCLSKLSSLHIHYASSNCSNCENCHFGLGITVTVMSVKL